MNEFIEKLIGRLELRKEKVLPKENYLFGNIGLASTEGFNRGIKTAVSIVNQLAEEYNNDFCEHILVGGVTSCGQIFLGDSESGRCPYCGKKNKGGGVMKEVFDKIIGFIHSEIARTTSYAEHDTQINIKFFVEQLRDEYNNGWIPCSERLPEEKGEYLVAYHPCYWNDVKEEICVGIDTFRGKTAWAKKKYQRVIAWMPLPEPFKPKGE